MMAMGNSVSIYTDKGSNLAKYKHVAPAQFQHMMEIIIWVDPFPQSRYGFPMAKSRS